MLVFPKDSSYVILLSGAPNTIYSDICDILDGGDELLKIREGDTFIVASPVLPGTEKIANKAQNDLFRTPTDVHILKNKQLPSMHASIEDIKVFIQLFNPKYYVPIKKVNTVVFYQCTYRKMKWVLIMIYCDFR